MNSNDLTTAAAWTMSYLGESVEDNTMDVIQLADALHSAQRLHHRANAIVNGNTAVASLRIRATSPGSFEVELLLYVAAALNVLSPNLVTTAVNLKELLTGDRNIIGVIGAFKHLRGRPHKVVDQSPDAVWLEAKDLRLNVPVRVFEILRDPRVRRALHGLVAPLRAPGMNRFDIRDEHGDLVSIGSSDIDPPRDDESQDATENVIEIPRQNLTVVAPNLDDPHAKWRLGNGQTISWYSILDKHFLQKVIDGDERFGTGDVLVCSVKITQELSKDYKISNDYQVTRVIEHHQREVQQPLL